jgi:hypothetical protein
MLTGGAILHPLVTVNGAEIGTCKGKVGLLQVSDCTNSPQFTLTQKFMSQMLMVRRASVGAVASEMLNRVLDRAALEAASCECYQAVEQEYNRLLM